MKKHPKGCFFREEGSVGANKIRLPFEGGAVERGETERLLWRVMGKKILSKLLRIFSFF